MSSAGSWLTALPLPLAAQELMELIHLHLVKEYIVRLCKRRLVLKTVEQQQQLAGQVLANADVIQHFCTQIVSPDFTPLTTHPRSPMGCPCPLSLSKLHQFWLNHSGPGRTSGAGAASLQPGLCLQGSPATWLHHALPKLAEIIRLQDPSAIKIEVVTYAACYPDFR